MKVSKLLVTGAFFGISTMSAAMPGLKSMQKELRKLAPKSAALAESCTDFSGTWEGTCYDANGKSDADSFSIDQYECKEITYSYGQSFSIGGSEITTKAAADLSQTTIYNLNWNDNKTEIVTNLTGSMNLIASPTLWQYRGKGIMKIKDDSLQTSFGFQLDTNSPSQPSGGSTSTCYYKKVK